MGRSGTKAQSRDGEHERALNNAEALLRDEFTQAWQHYRHLEQVRGQYLSFTFTVTLGSAALAIPLATTVGRSPGKLALVGGFVLLYALLNVFVYATLRKIRTVLLHYERVLRSVRNHFYSLADLRVEDLYLDIRKTNDPMVGHPLFRIQRSAELIPVFFLLIANSVQLALLAAFLSAHPAWFQVCLMSVMALGTVTVSAFVIIFVWRSRGGYPAAQQGEKLPVLENLSHDSTMQPPAGS